MEESQNTKDWLLPGSVIVAALLISGALIYNVGSKNFPENQQANISNTVKPADLLDDDVILGDPDAPVAVVEFGDYQCPFCGRFFSEVEPKIREEYIKSGKVKMVYRDFAFLGPESIEAALASQCAAEQKSFWTYHDALFAAEVNDGRENNGNLNEQFFKSTASNLKLDRNRFDSCLSSKKYLKEIEKDYNDGIAAGVRGTPATFINGKMISGAVAYSAFKAAIEEALSVLQ